MTRILAALDERWVAAASRELCVNLSTLVDKDLGEALKCVLAWTRFFPGEVDLSSFIVQQLDKRSVFLPRSLPDRTMSFIEIGKNWHLEIESGAYGIPEPKDTAGSFYDLKNSRKTIVIVPGMAFDANGNRLGRGKGYYDRFLSDPNMVGAIRIGVCWKLQLAESVPTNEDDVPMDWICHEEGFFKVGSLSARNLKE